MAYMPKSAVPVQGYMPKSAIPVQTYKPKSAVPVATLTPQQVGFQTVEEVTDAWLQPDLTPQDYAGIWQQPESTWQEQPQKPQIAGESYVDQPQAPAKPKAARIGGPVAGGIYAVPMTREQTEPALKAVGEATGLIEIPRFVKALPTIAEAQKQMQGPQPAQGYEDPEQETAQMQAMTQENIKRGKWLMTYVASLGGRLGPKGLRENLLKEAETFTGFGPAVAPAAGDISNEALQWGLVYPKVFKAVGLAGEAIGKLPKVKAAMEYITKAGGLAKLAESHPREVKAAVDAAKAFETGVVTGAVVQAPQEIGKGKSAVEVAADIAKAGAGAGAVAAVFRVASSIDTGMYVNRLRKELLDATKAKYDAKINALPKGMGDPGARTVIDEENRAVRAVDNIVSGVESHLRGLKSGVYQLGQEGTESPYALAQRLTAEGWTPELGIAAEKASAANLKENLGKSAEQVRGEKWYTTEQNKAYRMLRSADPAERQRGQDILDFLATLKPKGNEIVSVQKQELAKTVPAEVERPVYMPKSAVPVTAPEQPAAPASPGPKVQTPIERPVTREATPTAGLKEVVREPTVQPQGAPAVAARPEAAPVEQAPSQIGEVPAAEGAAQAQAVVEPTAGQAASPGVLPGMEGAVREIQQKQLSKILAEYYPDAAFLPNEINDAMLNQWRKDKSDLERLIAEERAEDSKAHPGTFVGIAEQDFHEKLRDRARTQIVGILAPYAEKFEEEEAPAAIPSTETPLHKAHSELLAMGKTAIGGKEYSVKDKGPGKGWITQVPTGTEGLVFTKGGDPRGGGWTREQAIDKLMDEIGHDVRGAEAQPAVAKAKPAATTAVPVAPKQRAKKTDYPVMLDADSNEHTLYGYAIDVRATKPDAFGRGYIRGTGWEWYAFEPPKGEIAFGYVLGDEKEWGSFSLAELRENGIGFITDPTELRGIMPPSGWTIKEAQKPATQPKPVDTGNVEQVESAPEVQNERPTEQLASRPQRNRPPSAAAPAEEPAEPLQAPPAQGPTEGVRPGRTRAGGTVSGEGQRKGKATGRNAGSDSGNVGQPAGRRPTPRRDDPAGGQLDYRITDTDNIEAGGQKTKYKNNVAAIRLLKQIESEQRNATADEQPTLVKYTGWGGLPQAFNGYDRDWQTEYNELHELLTDEEYNAARASTPNAHYTSPDVVQGIWKGLQSLGFTGGRINEPAIGTGMFYGLMPDEIAQASRLFGVELDNISARIARQLYQSASIENNGFQDVRYPDNFFDLFVSNVPFDEQTKPTDPDIRSVHFALHDFYFAKALKKTRPGGLVAFITSKGTMDKGNPTVRKYIAKQADLVGAVRLPKTAFGKIANTEVVTDIIILQKRAPGQAVQGESWTEIGELEQGGSTFNVNEYFVRHPDQILGKLSYAGSMYRANEMTVESTDIDLKSKVGELIGQFKTPNAINAEQVERDLKMRKPEYQQVAPENVKERAYVMQEGKVFQKIDGFLTPVTVGSPIRPRFAGMIRVRDAARRLIGLQIDPEADNADVEKARKELNKAYDTFAPRFEAFHTSYNQKLFYEDPDLPLLLALEEWDNDAKKATKAKIFTERTQFPVKAIDKAASPEDAVAISMSERGRIDVDYMADLLSADAQDLPDMIRGQAFENPETGTWEPAFLYLSGNVRKKLAAAEAAAKLDQRYATNIDALKAVQPEDVSPADISVRIGSPWVDADTYLDFLKYLTSRAYGVKFTKMEHDGSWIISGSATSAQYDTANFSTSDLVIEAMNYKEPTVWEKDSEGNRYVNMDATVAARVVQQKIKDEFERWIWSDPQRTTRLARVYNDLFNHTVFPQWDGSYLRCPGQSSTVLSGGRLRKHQLDAVARFLTGGNMLMAHAVGAGKTYAGITMAMEGRRTGQVKKAVFVVPNHKVDDWRTDWMKLYPSANILAATKKDFEPKNRQTLMNRIATGDWDGVIVPMSSFEKIPVSPERVRAFFQDQIDELEMEIRALQAERGRENKNIVKRLEKAKSALEEKLKKQEATWKKDAGPFFDELGIDMMLVDESHAYKNLFFASKMDRIAGIQVSQTQRSFDMFIKTKYLNEATRYRGIVFATGTPITNTLGEMFTLQRYLQPQMLREAGIGAFDFWAKTFGDTVTDVEIDPTGSGFRINTRFARFTNLPELMQMFRSVADIVTKKDMGIPLPKLKGGKPEVVQSDPSPDTESYIQHLVQRAEAIRRGHVKPWKDNMLAVTNDGRHVALDPRLRITGASDNPNSKINKLVDEVWAIHKEYDKDKALQVIWCDLSTPKKGQWSIYDDIKQKLIAKGIKKDEIAFIHDAADEKQQASLFLKANSGKIRVLMASTSKMGTGANVQQRLKAAHHLTAPWVPAEVEQRDGRIERQGNMYDEVIVKQYVTKGTFDAYMWQTLQTKAGFIEQVMRGETTAREIEDVSKFSLTAAEVKALASGNPKVLEVVKLDAVVKRLQAEEKAHRSEQFRIREEAQSVLPAKIFGDEKIIDALNKDVAKATKAIEAAGEGVDITIGTTKYDKRKEASEALMAAVGKVNKLNNNPTWLGDAYGFPMEVFWHQPLGGKAEDAVWRVKLNGAERYFVDLGDNAMGNITRIANAVASIEDKLKERTALLSRSQKRLAELNKILNEGFPKAKELSDKREQLAALQNEIGLDKKHDQSQQIVAEEAPEQPEIAEPMDEGGEDEGEEKKGPSGFRPGFAGVGAPPGMAGRNVPPVVVGADEIQRPTVAFKRYAKDINPFQKWIGSLSNQAKNTKNPTIIEIADVLVDTPITTREGLQRLIQESDRQYKKLPREYRRSGGVKFFTLMDSHYSPDEIDAATDIPDAVKPVLKWFKQVDEDIRKIIVEQKRAMARAVHAHQTTEQLVAAGVEKGLKWEVRDRTIGGLPTQSVYDLDAGQFLKKDQAADALAELDIPDTWGKQWAHIQHIFFGQYKLRVIDPEGKSHFVGTAETQGEAVEKLMDFYDTRRNAGEDVEGWKLSVDRDFNLPFDLSRVSTGQYYHLQTALKEALEAERSEIEQATRGIIGKQSSKRKFWGALMQRHGVAGYSQDFTRVWHASLGQFVRWRRLGEMNARVTPLIEKLRADGLPGWADHLAYLRDDLMGRKRSDSAKWLDDRLARIPALHWFVKPWALERWTGRLKGINYLRQLQTVRFAIVNKLQLIQTLWPVVGERQFIRGVKLYYSKRGRKILHELGVSTEGKFRETGIVARKRAGAGWSPASWSERGNQGVAFLCLYDQGIRMGMSEADAARYGRLRGQVFTQFAHSPADMPRMMKGNIGGLIFQYRRFTIKNLELLSRLVRDGNVGGVARWLAALMMVGGTNAFLRVATSLPVVGYLTYKAYKAIEREYGKETADMIHHGLPALVGVDLSGSVTPVDVPYGRTVSEKIGNVVLGPTGQTIQRLVTDMTSTEVAGDRGIASRALQSLLESSPTFKQVNYLIKALERDTTTMDTKQRAAYELEVADLWKRALGAVPETESLQRMQRDAMLSLKYEYDKELDRVALARIAGDKKKAAELIVQWNARWPEAPITLSDSDARMKSRQEAAKTPTVDRTFNALPKELKGAFLDQDIVSDEQLRKLRRDNTYDSYVKPTAGNSWNGHMPGETKRGSEPIVRAIDKELKRRRSQQKQQETAK